jgi:hypothetical protein
MTDSLDRARAALRERGYTVATPEDRAAPAAVATPGPDASPLDPVDGGIALEPLETRSRIRRSRDAATPPVDPTRVVDAVAAAAERDLTCTFVVGERAAAGVREVLTDPPGVRAVEDGCRTFYDVPDRLSTGEGLACVRTDDPPVWREEPATGGVTDESDPRATADRTGLDRAGGTDRPTRLVLAAGGGVHAAFDDYAALACPTAEAFPYTYRREADKRVHVRNRDGREVGVYSSIRAMKADAYRPVADPLVPEIHLDDTPLRTAWLLAVDDGSVRFER